MKRTDMSRAERCRELRRKSALWGSSQSSCTTCNVCGPLPNYHESGLDHALDHPGHTVTLEIVKTITYATTKEGG